MTADYCGSACGHEIAGTHIILGEGKGMGILCIACTISRQEPTYCWKSPVGYSVAEVKQMTQDRASVVR
jgi:hypothetical protein